MKMQDIEGLADRALCLGIKMLGPQAAISVSMRDEVNESSIRRPARVQIAVSAWRDEIRVDGLAPIIAAAPGIHASLASAVSPFLNPANPFHANSTIKG